MTTAIDEVKALLAKRIDDATDEITGLVVALRAGIDVWDYSYVVHKASELAEMRGYARGLQMAEYMVLKTIEKGEKDAS